jgi:NADPH2:quinone reductase
MKEALVSGGPKVVIVDSPIPKPSADQVMIKVVYSGCNPKDWKGPHYFNVTANSGDDIAGIIHAVGQNITEFKIGDRVAAFHQMKTPGGSFAEYAVAPGWTTFHLPKNTSFEEVSFRIQFAKL